VQNKLQNAILEHQVRKREYDVCCYYTSMCMRACVDSDRETGRRRLREGEKARWKSTRGPLRYDILGLIVKTIFFRTRDLRSFTKGRPIRFLRPMR